MKIRKIRGRRDERGCLGRKQGARAGPACSSSPSLFRSPAAFLSTKALLREKTECSASPIARAEREAIETFQTSQPALRDSRTKERRLVSKDGASMPEEEAVERAKRDKEEGKSPSTQAGEFVREEIEHVREGKHGARSVQQAIAIGLSKARRAGVALPPPKAADASADVRERAARDLKRGKRPHAPSPRRSRAVKNALGKESKSSVSSKALSTQGRRSARRRGPA